MFNDAEQRVEQDPLATLDQIEDEETSSLDKEEITLLARLLRARVNL